MTYLRIFYVYPREVHMDLANNISWYMNKYTTCGYAVNIKHLTIDMEYKKVEMKIYFGKPLLIIQGVHCNMTNFVPLWGGCAEFGYLGRKNLVVTVRVRPGRVTGDGGGRGWEGGWGSSRDLNWEYYVSFKDHIGTESSVHVAYFLVLEHHHPNMRTLWGHGGRSKLKIKDTSRSLYMTVTRTSVWKFISEHFCRHVSFIW